MSAVWMQRTPAARHFREKAGYANFRLNTIVVGLEGVKQGAVTKPPDLAVHWKPKNVEVAAGAARGFATNAVMVYVVDALDSYMSELAHREVWIDDVDTNSMLRGDFQIDRSQSVTVTTADSRKLAERLNVLASSPVEIETLLRDFNAKHFGRRKRPSMRARFAALMALVGTVPEHYNSAIQFLISWRNRHVHGRSTERVSQQIQSCLIDVSSLFYNHHAHLDVQRMIANYDAGNPPTLKEVSSLIAVLHRVIANADESILRKADARRAFVASLRIGFNNEQSVEQRIKGYWGKDIATRQAKLTAMVNHLGFRSDAAPTDCPLYLADEKVRRFAEMTRDDFIALVL